MNRVGLGEKLVEILHRRDFREVARCGGGEAAGTLGTSTGRGPWSWFYQGGWSDGFSRLSNRPELVFLAQPWGGRGNLKCPKAWRPLNPAPGSRRRNRLEASRALAGRRSFSKRLRVRVACLSFKRQIATAIYSDLLLPS